MEIELKLVNKTTDELPLNHSSLMFNPTWVVDEPNERKYMGRYSM